MTYNIVKGGSCYYTLRFCQVTSTSGSNGGFSDVGFRLIKTIKWWIITFYIVVVGSFLPDVVACQIETSSD